MASLSMEYESTLNGGRSCKMEQYFFLFGLALVWIVFAVVQDLRTREISNWLNFSLIAIVLAYRAFYSIIFENLEFLLYGIGGVVLFVGFGYLFYYSRVFAGGDAKLLFGLGGVLPFERITDYLFYGGGFIFLLFLTGIVYSLIYTGILVARKREEFKRDFLIKLNKNKKWIVWSFVFFGGGAFILLFNGFGVGGLWFLAFPLILLLYVYVKSVESVCMINNVKPGKLMEGDWLEKDVKLGKKWIRKSVHGLSLDEIKILMKNGKKVWIKDGVPFSPAFLLALILGVYWYLRYSAF
jgi:Flp pilus assembly protein protease CpaA